ENKKEFRQGGKKNCRNLKYSICIEHHRMIGKRIRLCDCEWQPRIRKESLSQILSKSSQEWKKKTVRVVGGK
ncbi:MAG TPA: hypothetical protein PKK94_22635, partial [Leptospiraceae bacterium]|nr:hypothetical protein [Leptospiraceae bacterium]